MKPRSKKPKCAAANKACGMACKPKAAICADQRKKLLANAKKGGLKGQAAKDYVQARIDRYKKLVSGKAEGGVPDTSKPASPKPKPIAQKPLKNPTKKVEGATADEKRGELVTSKKAPDKAPKKSIFDQIDDNWASDDPTEADAQSWIKDRIEARFNPTPENVEQRTVEVLKARVQRNEKGMGIDANEFSSRVFDRDSYAKAFQAVEDWERKNKPEEVAKRLKEEYWIEARSMFGEAPPMGEVKRDVARQAAIQSASKVDRVEQLKREFDEEAEEQKFLMKGTYLEIKEGRKSTIKEATIDAAQHAKVYPQGGWENLTGQPTVSDFQNHLKELALGARGEAFKVDKNTTKAEVRKQYRALAEGAHPDKPGGSAEKFRKLTEAYNKILERFN